jgi:hypothetical protein
VVLVVVLVVLVGLAVGAVIVSRSPGTGAIAQPAAQSSGAPATSQASAPETTASPSSAALSPEDYQRRLAAFDAAIGAAFRRLPAARTPRALTSALTALRTALVREVQTLRFVQAPEPVQAAHAGLLAGLDTLASDVADAVGASNDWNVCVGSSGTSLLSRSPGAAQVRSAVARMAAADPTHQYRVATFIPRRTGDTKRRLTSGKMIKRGPGGGLGQLEIRNGGSSDAAVSLVTVGGSKPTVTVYVRSNGSFTINGIGDGNYTGYVTTGDDWDQRARGFSRSCNFFRFADRFDFRTTSTQFTVWRISLTPQSGGTAQTKSVDPDSFPG